MGTAYTAGCSVASISCVARPSMALVDNLTRRAWPREYIPRLSPPSRRALGFTALFEAGSAVDTAHETQQRLHKSQSKGAALRWPKMEENLTLVPDARLARLASERGPTSAEAYVILELREVRSAGDQVFAFRTNGRYTVRSALKPSGH